MSKKYTKRELKALIVSLAIDHQRAQLAVVRRRSELNEEYSRYFRAHGDPEPNYRGIRWGDPRYEGVINHTNDFYHALREAKRDRYNVKRRMDIAVRRLMLLTNESFAVPATTAVRRHVLRPVKRSTACGETLQ